MRKRAPVVAVTTDYDTLYGVVTDDTTPVPASPYLDETAVPGLAAATGPIGDHLLTGTCFQTPAESQALKTGLHPITDEPLEGYDDVVSYLEAAPTSLSVFADQFGHTEMEDGHVYIIQEDEEWPAKIADQLDHAGIEYDQETLENDVNEAYDTVIETFETYITDVLDNDVETTVITTSSMQDPITSYIESFKTAHDIDQDEGIYETICLLTSPFGMDLIEDQYDLDVSLDMIDPPRHHPYLFDTASDAANIFAEPSLKYLMTDETNHQIGLTYPCPDELDALDLSVLDQQEQDTTHLSEDPLATAALLVPHEPANETVLTVQQDIDADKEQLKEQAEQQVAAQAGVDTIETIFHNPEEYDLSYWGSQISATMDEYKQDYGLDKAKQQLAANLTEQLAPISETL